MTRTVRALVTSPIAVLALWATVVAAAQPEPSRGAADQIAARPPASAGAGSPMLSLPPILAEIVQPLVLAALCGAALAFFSAGPRQAVKARLPRRRWRA